MPEGKFFPVWLNRGKFKKFSLLREMSKIVLERNSPRTAKSNMMLFLSRKYVSVN